MTIAIGGGPTIAENIRHDPADGTRSIGRHARGNGTPTPISNKGCGVVKRWPASRRGEEPEGWSDLIV